MGRYMFYGLLRIVKNNSPNDPIVKCFVGSQYSLSALHISLTVMDTIPTPVLSNPIKTFKASRLIGSPSLYHWLLLMPVASIY